jgi:hypothetical protein
VLWLFWGGGTSDWFLGAHPTSLWPDNLITNSARVDMNKNPPISYEEIGGFFLQYSG